MRASNPLRSRGVTAFILATSMAVAACAPGSVGIPNSLGTPDFDFTGTVYDKSTMQPIEGAYVVAIYHEDAGPPPAYKTWCVKTLGMYTGKDGKFHFPVTRIDGRSPMMASAIKTGYYRAGFDVTSREVWQRQDASTYSNRNIYLAPQVPSNPQYPLDSGEEFCPQAKTAKDAEAGLHFLRLQVEELKRIGAPSSVVTGAKELVESREIRSRAAVGSSRVPEKERP